MNAFTKGVEMEIGELMSRILQSEQQTKQLHAKVAKLHPLVQLDIPLI